MAVELPKVSQDFTADAEDYLAEMDRLITKNRDVIDSIGKVQAAIDGLHDKEIKVTLDGEDEVLEQVAYIRELMGGLEDKTVTVFVKYVSEGKPDDIAAASETMTEHVNTINDASENLDQMDESTVKLAEDTATLGEKLTNTDSATRDLGAAAADSIPSWFSWTRQLQTFGGALEMVLGKQVPLVTSIAAWHLVLDSAAEGIIAVSGALIALGAAAAGMAPSMLDIYNHLVATRDVIESFGVQVKPFNSWFLNLQHAMQTDSIELYGEALLDLGKANGQVATSIKNVGDAIDRMGAKISEWVGSNGNLASTISKGAQYAKEFGDVLGNLIVIIDELIKADSGIVLMVLEFVSGFTKAVAAVLGFSEALDRVALLAHGFLLWGGLLSSFLMNLALVFLTPIANILAFVGGVQGATAAIKEFEVANDVAANPIQKMGIVAQTVAASFKNMGTAIGTWAAGIGTAMGEAEGAVATAGAGIKAAIVPIGEAIADIAVSPAGILAAAAALGYMAYEGMQATASAKSLGSALQQQIANDNASQAILDIGAAIGKLNQQMSTTTPAAMGQAAQSAESFGVHFQATGEEIEGTGAAFGKALASVPEMLSSWPALGHTITSFGDAFKDMVTGGGAATQAASQNINYYKGLISQFSSSQQTLFKVAGTTMQQNSIGYVQALGLMDAAGVKAGEGFQTAMTQVDGLIQGYKNLGVQGGALGNSINAITLQTEQQETEISKITGAWTNFITLVTGGESSFVTVAQQVQGTMAAAGGAASSLSISNGKVTDSIKNASAAAGGAKVHIDSLTTAGLALKSSFIQSDQAMSGNLNNLMQLSSAAGLGQQGLNKVDQAGKDYVASLLPVAQGSQDATAMLYALAQQAGYTGADSFKSLATWVGNVKNPMQQAENITNQMTIAAGNLANDVKNLANAIDTDLNSAMALAVLSGNKTQAAFNNAANAIHNAHGNITDMLPSIKTLGQSLYQDLGGNIQETNNELTTFMKAMGLTPGQIKTILAAVDASFAQSASNIGKNLETIQQEINSLHGKNIQITTSYVTSGGTVPGLTEGIPAGVKAAAGYLVPGSGSGDTVPAMLSPGEAVVPKHLVSAVAPFLGAHKVPGFAAGGMVAPMLPPVPDPTGLALLQQQLTGLGGDVTKDTSQVSSAALTAAKAHAALIAAQGILTGDEKNIKALDAKTAAAKALDARAAATLKAAETAESKAKSHLTALERLPLNFKDELAVYNAKNVYNAAASAVTRDKAALAAAGRLVTTDENVLANAKSSEVSAAANYLNMQRLERNDQTALALAQLDQKQTQTQLSQLQKIQAGSAGISSMNDLLLPGTPLATLAAAMPGVGLAWGAPASAAAAAAAPLPVLSFDSGGYLPSGLSLAYNGTGGPEPVGGAGGEIHSHISVHLDGQQIWSAVQKETLRNNIRNNGVATGLMKPR